MTRWQEQMTPVSEFGATVRCRECTIFIGEGHLEEVPHRLGDAPDPLCAACRRRGERRASARSEPGAAL